MDILQEVGRQLDQNIFPNVKNGGIVVPNTTSASLLISGEDKKNERKRQGRPETRSRPRTTRWQRQTYKCRPTSPTASLISTDLKAKYEANLSAVNEAYPGTRVWHQPEGLWLLTESSLLPDHWHKAVFLTGFSFVWPFVVRSWGFWIGGLLREPAWIGPRHTNFPDGSVCAFEPTDGTWSIGTPVVTLLDLYTLWALRHLHLEVFGRWPGHQFVTHPYERISELREDELCGCENSDNLYGECCQKNDLARDRVADAIEFRFRTGGGLRKPPDTIMKFIGKQTEPPNISDLFR